MGRAKAADATLLLPLIFDVVACVPSLFPLRFEAPQRWRDVEASVMTLLSADAQAADDFIACVMILLPPHFGPASGFKYTDAFPRICTVPNY